MNIPSIFGRTISLLLIWQSGFLFAQRHYPLRPQQDILHYTFAIMLNDSNNLITGRATLVYRLMGSDTLYLDLVNRQADSTGMVVQTVMYHGKAAAYSHRHNRLAIHLPAAGHADTVVINYQGILANGLIIGESKFGKRVFFGDNYPDRARHWLPCVDHPADKATLNWVITAPQHYRIVASGTRTAMRLNPDGTATTTWQQTVPLSTKVMVLAAANFAVDTSGVVNGIPVTTWVYEDNKADGFHDFATAPAILAFYDSLIGPYPFSKLAHVQSKTMYGGMENAGNIFYFEDAVNGRASIDYLIAHETVHQWFGNSATEKDWPHAWLSEGFATYLTHEYARQREGEAVFRQRLADDRQKVLAYWQQKPLPIVNTGLVTFPQVADLWELLSANTYQKAGWALHMLRQEIGEEAFWQTIRTYYRTYRDSIAGTEDFRHIAETVSDRSLVTFFRQWFYTAGQPVLQGSWQYQNGRLVINLEQKQTPVFDFPLQIAIVSGDKQQITTLHMTQQRQTFRLESAPPEAILLDPQVNLLFQGPARLPRQQP